MAVLVVFPVDKAKCFTSSWPSREDEVWGVHGMGSLSLSSASLCPHASLRPSSLLRSLACQSNRQTHTHHLFSAFPLKFLSCLIFLISAVIKSASSGLSNHLFSDFCCFSPGYALFSMSEIFFPKLCSKLYQFPTIIKHRLIVFSFLPALPVTRWLQQMTFSTSWLPASQTPPL